MKSSTLVGSPILLSGFGRQVNEEGPAAADVRRLYRGGSSYQGNWVRGGKEAQSLRESAMLIIII